MNGYKTPEEAAMDGFPPQHVRVVATRIAGDDAYVLLDTGSRERPYLYGVNCKRGSLGWYESASCNGGGWSLSDEKLNIGTWALWDDAPLGATHVRVEFDGVTSEHVIQDGFYLVVFFKRPFSPAPHITAITI